MTNIRNLGRVSSTCALSILSVVVPVTLAASAQKGAAPTQAQVDCQNQAVNDYWTQAKLCEQSLSDIPEQLAQCQSDARADLDRAKNACLSSRTVGGRVPGLMKDPVIKHAPK